MNNPGWPAAEKAACCAIQGWMARKSSMNMLDLARVGFAHDG
jgi:hypothetical protein